MVLPLGWSCKIQASQSLRKQTCHQKAEQQTIKKFVFSITSVCVKNYITGLWWEGKMIRIQKEINLASSLIIYSYLLTRQFFHSYTTCVCIQYIRNQKMIHVQIIRVLEKELASQGMSTYLTIHVLFVFDSILVSHNSLHPNTTSNCSYIYI